MDTLGQNDLVFNMLGSATSGALARFPAHPLDTIKAKLQVQQTMLNGNIVGAKYALNSQNMASLTSDPHSQSSLLPKIRKQFGFIGEIIAGNPTKYNSKNNTILINGIFDGFKKIFMREGIVGFYRGLTISTIVGCPATCIYFTTFEYTRHRLSKIENSNNLLSDFIGGFTAEIVSCLLYVPIDVIKERMQVQSIINDEKRYKSTYDAFRTMFVNEGVNGLYKAYGATIASYGPFSALYLMLYEQLKVYYNAETPHKIALCACISGGFSAFVTNPLDIVKVRMQVQRAGIFQFGYKNILDGFIKLIKYESFLSLFHGANARVAYQVPNLAINLTLYETCTKFYRNRFMSLQS